LVVQGSGALSIFWGSAISLGEWNSGMRREARTRRRGRFEGGDASGLGVAGGLLFAQEQGEFTELQLECGDGALAVAQARVEFAFAQGEDVRADGEGLLLVGGGALRGLQFKFGAAAAFIEGLHPQGFGDVGDGFGESMQGGGPGVQAGGESFPPGI
jgi:hypothetical protein